MNSILKVANYFSNNAQSLAMEIVDSVLLKLNLDIPEWERKNAVKVYTEFLGFLGASLSNGELDKVPKGLIEWSKKNGEREASSGGRISEIIRRYPETRAVFTELITTTTEEHQLAMEQFVYIITRLNYMLDLSISETIKAFETLTEEIIKKAQNEVVALSAPIVPIQDGIAVLPLIGAIDTERAEFLMENAIPKVIQLNIQCLIIDFSGLATIDTSVANHLFNIHSALRLLGIKAIITGIRAELAKAVVSSGIDLSSIRTYANVKQAIEAM
ncbi:STAS domain-containing protein [Peribacillus saganii]|uniref:STAS domain-containing protein n=1 Tax=Peribacillus saganii TaxID=2303992 RepID=A0A372LR50_9BACI|nr:STAS domain-containing protein [Peribacillus saganii]RFU70681.1 STAS domain-containing protein [Peribacillus saganii]